MPDQRHEVLGKAAGRAAAKLGLSPEQYLAALGADLTGSDGISAMDEDGLLDPQSTTGKKALQIIRIYDRLQYQMGDNAVEMDLWMTTENRRLRARPIDLMTTKQGLDQIEVYLESMTR
jgi:antitoxin Xre/MbcA/ParS-like protein